ncbi:MAG: shikimate kinase [Phormidesmis sp. RL_2_1]|nr:shikimate kinase [Phormidesmis sp. RL_2_1]
MTIAPPVTRNSAFLKRTNLYLIGMMGAGKTTIGRKLAHRLGYRFLDTDLLIEQTANRSINELFATEGEAAFRTLETQVLAEVSTYTNLVVATGGGIVTQPMNWSYLQHGVVIWLDVPIAILVSRLSNDSSRPLLKEANKAVDLTAKLQNLMAQRAHHYAQADLHIPFEGRSISKTCDHIITTLQQNIRPDPKLTAPQITISHPTSLISPSLANLRATNRVPACSWRGLWART